MRDVTGGRYVSCRRNLERSALHANNSLLQNISAVLLLWGKAVRWNDAILAVEDSKSPWTRFKNAVLGMLRT